MTPDHVSWMTYDEVAGRLAIKRRSAERLAARKRWPRRPGNDGRVRIGVPSDALPVAPVVIPDNTPADRGDDRGDDGGAVAPDGGGKDGAAAVLAELVSRLHDQVADLTGKLVQAEKEATAAPVLRQSMEALRQALESERLLRDELRRELDLARRPWWRRLVG
jgi:hypothetical protein